VAPFNKESSVDTIELVRWPDLRYTLGACCCGLLVACGGGDVDDGAVSIHGAPATTPMIAPPNVNTFPPQSPTACPAIGDLDVLGDDDVNAVVGGQIAYASERDWVIMVMRNGGTTLAFYGTDETTVADLAGYMYTGGPWWSSSDPSVYNGRDWGRFGEAVCLKAAYSTTTPSLTGSLTVRNGPSATLEGGAIPGSSYSFDLAASLAQAAGDYTLPDGGSLSIAASGSLAGVYGGCNFTGTLASQGKNAFYLTLQYSSTCASLPAWARNQQGFAIPYTPADGIGRLLLFSEVNDGVDFYATNAIAKK
jgi:hypothetical protein